MPNYPVIRPIVVGVFPNFEVSLFLHQRRQGEKGEFPILIYVIELENGKKIVVDTGPCGPGYPSAKYHMPVSRTPEMEPRTALETIGVKPEEVETVILTHLHWDHVSNCKSFTNATFFVQKSELQYGGGAEPCPETVSTRWASPAISRYGWMCSRRSSRLKATCTISPRAYT